MTTSSKLSTSILSNTYADIFYQPEADCIVLRFKAESAQMSDEHFKEVMRTYARWVEARQITKLLLDNRQLKYIVVPEMQEWITQNITPLTGSLRYVANVVAEDIFAEVSAEQSIEESQRVRPLETAYFRSTEEAIDWLKQQQ